MTPTDYLSKEALLTMFQRDPSTMTSAAKCMAAARLVRRHGLTEYPDPTKAGICYSKSECMAVWESIQPLTRKAA